MKLANRGLKSFALLVSGAVLFVFTSCSTQPPWKGLNEKVINEHKIQGRERQIPHTEVIPSLDPGKVYSSKELPSIKIAPVIPKSPADSVYYPLSNLSLLPEFEID